MSGTRAASLVVSSYSSDGVQLSPDLWNSLLAGLDSASKAETDPQRLTVAIAPLNRSASVQAQNGKIQPASLVVHATKAPDSAVKTTDAVHASRPLIQAHLNVFGHPRPTSEPTVPSLVISLTKAVPLSSVVLIALDTASYTFASSDQAAFEADMEQSAAIVREGEVVNLGGHKGMSMSSMRWKVAMAEPVLQGVCQKGYTRFIVLPPLDGSDGSAVESGSAQAPMQDVKAASGQESDDEDLEIDESFLAASVLAPPRPSQPSTPMTSPPSRVDEMHHAAGSSLLSQTPSTPKRRAPGSLVVQPQGLQCPMASEVLVPRPAENEDDTPRVYLRNADLGRIGVFSGDWLLAEPCAPCQSQTRRLVRAFAADGPLAGFVKPEHALAPPILLHNLQTEAHGPVRLTSARLADPVFPTAKSVTVARVASPHSVNRAYQPLFLEGLKQYFQSHRRILKQGDLIAVGICEENVRFIDLKSEEDDIDLPVSSSAPTAVVYFQISSLELPALSTLPVETSDQALRDQLDAGELGCLVDPLVTKLLQTGLEHSLVPDAAGFLGVCHQSQLEIGLSPLGDPTPSSRLLEYVQASLRPGASQFDLHLTVLIKGARGSGKRTLARAIARRTGFHLLELDCFDLLGESELKTEGHLRARIDKAISCSPCMMLLRNIEALARKSQALETGQEPAMTTVLRECFASARQGWKSTGHPVIILGTTCDIEKIPTGVLGAFKEEINIEAPGEPERHAILKSLTADLIIAPDVSLRALAVQTAALVANDLVDLVRRACSAAASRVLAVFEDASTVTMRDLQHAGLALTAVDFNEALEKARSSYSESIGAPKIPSVTWDDVGGLANVKTDILDTIQLPLEHPELFADGLKKRSGILLYGPPGTGKTLLAKAVATSCSLNFFSVKGPELLNMYIGESEANVRRVFQRARDAKPCVIFFDELDSVAPKRGNQGDSGGVMDRIVSQLLAELDGMAEGKGGSDVFVIGATNRPDLLDPALLRPGRFDRMLYLGVSDNHDSQLKIIQALTRKFKLDPNTRLEDVAALCPFNYTGADFYALCSDAMLKAMTRKAEDIDRTIAKLNKEPPYSTGTQLTPQYYLAEMASPAEIEVLVAQQDFEAALAELVPSVSQAEMQHYKLVQQRFSTETMNSDDKMQAKEKEQKAALQQMPVQEAPRLNGDSTLVSMNGHANSHDPEPDDVPVVQDRKGKGKADGSKGKKDKGKGKARAG